MHMDAPANIAQHRARLKFAGTPGERMAYLDEGPRTGKPVVLLHGMPTSSWLYRHVVPGLVQKGLRVIAPDMLGFGASDKPADPSCYAFALQADRLVALMRLLGIFRWTQVVHDLGGPWTWELADRHPQVLNGLVVLNTTAYRDGFVPPAVMKMAGGPLGSLMAFMMRNRVTGPSQIRSLFRQFMAHPDKLTEAAVQGYWLSMYEGSDQAFLAFARVFPWWFAQFDRYGQALRRLDIPAATIWGRHDKVLSANRLPDLFAKDLNIPTRLQHVLEAGHFLQEDQPEALTDLLVAFMQEVPELGDGR